MEVSVLIIALEEAKRRLSALAPSVKQLRESLRIDALTEEAKELEAKTYAPDFWENQETSGVTLKQLKRLKDTIEEYEALSTRFDDAVVLTEMAIEEDDESSVEEVTKEVDFLEREAERLRLETLLTGEYDHNNAILSFHPGAGGTEAQDWAQMLQRMYLRWADSHGFSVEELDFLPGDEAGIKSVSLRISGENVYGFLKGERGIHRLIRISPFDSSGRRHTSFASVDVIPDAGDDIEIEIKESDLRVDIFCASGPGGQGVNTTYSAVRITHIPTGISVQCQNERSQHHNKDSAMRILRGRLYDLELSKRDAARQAEYAGKNAISFGSQIRTYTLQPYRLVKDHRNNCEIGDTDAVLDGRIDKLLRDYLLWQHTNRQQQQQ